MDKNPPKVNKSPKEQEICGFGQKGYGLVKGLCFRFGLERPSLKENLWKKKRMAIFFPLTPIQEWISRRIYKNFYRLICDDTAYSGKVKEKT
ncbi:MAG: hypothetical protein LBE80_03505 [Deltaproteobacteria bacterium]|nr:hypothetical protein [Deltaproteobacteria bacterium]